MSKLKFFNGVSWVEANDIKVFTGSSFVNPTTIRVFNGVDWVEVWPLGAPPPAGNIRMLAITVKYIYNNADNPWVAYEQTETNVEYAQILTGGFWATNSTVNPNTSGVYSGPGWPRSNESITTDSPAGYTLLPWAASKPGNFANYIPSIGSGETIMDFAGLIVHNPSATGFAKYNGPQYFRYLITDPLAGGSPSGSDTIISTSTNYDFRLSLFWKYKFADPTEDIIATIQWFSEVTTFTTYEQPEFDETTGKYFTPSTSKWQLSKELTSTPITVDQGQTEITGVSGPYNHYSTTTNWYDYEVIDDHPAKTPWTHSTIARDTIEFGFTYNGGNLGSAALQYYNNTNSHSITSDLPLSYRVSVSGFGTVQITTPRRAFVTTYTPDTPDTVAVVYRLDNIDTDLYVDQYLYVMPSATQSGPETPTHVFLATAMPTTIPNTDGSEVTPTSGIWVDCQEIFEP